MRGLREILGFTNQDAFYESMKAGEKGSVKGVSTKISEILSLMTFLPD